MPGGSWPLLNLRPLHRIVIFAIENHFSLAKFPPLLLEASSTSDANYAGFCSVRYAMWPRVTYSN